MTSLLRYAVSIIVRPRTTWRAIAGERMSFWSLVLGYVVPLALLGPIATFVSRRFVGTHVGHVVYRVSSLTASEQAIFSLLFTLGGLALVTAIVAALAPFFGARNRFRTAFRIAAFAYTPVWLAAVLVLAPIAFAIHVAVQLCAFVYEIFLLLAGIEAVMALPRGRAGGLAACATIGAVAIAVVFGEITALMANGA